MTFKKEIEQSLEQIRVLEECFRQTRHSEILPISFFSTSYDIVKELAQTLHHIEQEQLKFMEERFISNKISFLETTDLINRIKSKSNVQSEVITKPKEETIAEVAEPKYIETKNEQQQETPEIFIEKSEKTEQLLTELLPSSEAEQLKNSFFADTFQVKPAKILANIQKQMTLNDKFRFQREIFSGSSEEMNKVFDKLNGFSTIDDTLAFIENQTWWNPDSEIVMEFKDFIEKRFS